MECPRGLDGRELAALPLPALARRLEGLFLARDDHLPGAVDIRRRQHLTELPCARPAQTRRLRQVAAQKRRHAALVPVCRHGHDRSATAHELERSLNIEGLRDHVGSVLAEREARHAVGMHATLLKLVGNGKRHGDERRLSVLRARELLERALLDQSADVGMCRTPCQLEQLGRRFEALGKVNGHADALGTLPRAQKCDF